MQIIGNLLLRQLKALAAVAQQLAKPLFALDILFFHRYTSVRR